MKLGPVGPVRSLIEDEYRRLIQPVNISLESLWSEFNLHINSPSPHSGHLTIPPTSAQGDILYCDFNLNWTNLPASAHAGDLLRTNGPGADPDWIDLHLTTDGTNLFVHEESVAGDTDEFRVYGYAAADALRNFSIQVGSAGAETVEFKLDGVRVGIHQVALYSYGVGEQALRLNTASYNNAFGYRALYTNSTGSNNNAFGHAALYTNSTGQSNNAFGHAALYTNSTGQSNNAFGHQALRFNTASYNNAFGAFALYENSTGQSNSAFGHQALRFNTASYNSAFGYLALYTNSTGQYNSAFGSFALYANSTGQYNSAFGYRALRFNTASCNSAFGDFALYANSTGQYNSAFGHNALRFNTGSSHCAFGHEALYTIASGAPSCAFGYQSLNLATGDRNHAFGYQSGDSITTGSDNLLVGNKVDVSAAAVNDEFRLGNIDSNATTLLWGDMANNRLGIGVSSIPLYKLVLGGLATMDYGYVDCGTAGATEAAWIEVKYDLGGTPTTGYIRVYSSK